MIGDPVSAVEAELAVLAAVPALQQGERYSAWRGRRDTAITGVIARLSQAGAHCKVDWQGAVFRFAGIRSTSTSGFEGALNNWLRRARAEQGK